jgi:hypothetical protein
MSTTVPTAELLALYFEGRKKSPVYDTATAMYHQLRVHAQGEQPHHLIGERRPNESEEIRRYRMQIYEPITRQTMSRVLQSLGKIRRSPDWAITYDRQATFPLIPAGETLADYCEAQLPQHGSVTNWLFSIGLQSLLTDANCAVLVLPLEQAQPTTYRRPVPIVFHADQIIEHRPGSFAILRAADPVQVSNGRGGTQQSDKFYLVTPQEVVPYVKEGKHWTALTAEVVVHGLGYLPLIVPRGQYLRAVQGYPLYESRLAAMLPSLNEAAREYSDLQAAVVSHLFPERWEIATQECSVCLGSGYVPNTQYTGTDLRSKQLVCTACHGLGATAGSSPYRKTVIRLPRTNLGEQPVPTPPFDYVKKDVEVIKVMEERLERHLYRGLSAINMQFLAQTPLSISGEAKQVDRDELNNFVYNIAEDLVYVADRLYAIIADYRYSYQYPAVADRRRMLPRIAVPERYELLGADATMAAISQLRTNGIGGSVLTALLAEYTQKQWGQEKDTATPLLLEMQLDPFAGMSVADRATLLATGTIPRRDYLCSIYISSLVRRALAEQPRFAQLPYMQQVSILHTYVAEMENTEQGIGNKE